ncbi:MAG TPA: Hsp20/alpha crystallin family protein [Candidatus Binatia bacterium]|nr:Hsp20/alpha crystallin family protein [Candidatus Binatia bacterium]
MANQIERTSGKRKSLVPWRAFAEMPQWEREMDRMFGDFFRERVPSLWSERLWPQRSLGMPEPAVDIYDEKDEFVVKAELPGMSKDDIQVNVTDNVLTIKGEKKKEESKEEKDYYRSERIYGAFMRSLSLPAEINSEKVRATFKDGVLEVRLPKSEQAKKKQISVELE